MRILEALNPHEHIVPMIEALSDQFHYYIVLELLEGGELLQRLRRMEKFTEIQVEKRRGILPFFSCFRQPKSWPS